MKEFWNERYAVKEFVYGKSPNSFFKQFIDNETPGSILLPSEGEGRNAVYAAVKGWIVHAIDYSDTAHDKAMQWAEENNVSLSYEIADIVNWEEEIKTDCIGLIFAHFHADYRQDIHRKLIERLNTGGTIILEAFSDKQLNYNSGGPKSPEMLYNPEMLKNDFASLQLDFLQERTVNLDEGGFHNGEASVVRMIAKKT
jgi:hypothetical protein